MTFTQSVKTCFRKYFTFSGRASRSEYWWFFLFLVLGSIVASILDSMIFGAVEVDTGPGSVGVESNGPLGSLFSLATFIPALAAGWRRMHDTGKSGLYLLYPLIVMIGIAVFAMFTGAFEQMSTGDIGTAFTGVLGIVLMIALVVLAISPLLVLWWLTRPSQPGPNEYGPNPHEVPS
ncbi:DUF805 domain-containing protein [Pseudaestuariivita atlantica]|uniref:DUF805 domain-containing protein n=1 Tax=Pseudaestuariivita atlantica TaxID=1317121 RepID=A0A0L1JRG1_9RHOB|nr:DUF805 domain-containing protein [Pseudaestuariivita atlantica]KNG94389.1 hypothetical protein ATO11_09360 [Pseudaestuariivita atlantica]